MKNLKKLFCLAFSGMFIANLLSFDINVYAYDSVELNKRSLNNEANIEEESFDITATKCKEDKNQDDALKIKISEYILQKAKIEYNEEFVRAIKNIFKDVSGLNESEIINFIKTNFDISLDENSEIIKEIKTILNIPLLEDIVLDEKYKGLAILKKDITKENDLEIITKFMTRNDCFSANKTIDVNGIMVHSTASPGKMADFWYTPWNKSYAKGETNRQVCVHAFLDDKKVCQYLPWNHRGWHAGGKANNTHIGFEICEPEGIVYSTDHSKIDSIDIEGTREYFEKAYNNAVKLTAMLCKQFNLTEKDVICHCEGHEQGIASNHQDVMHWWKFYGKDMNMFREDVKKELQKNNIKGQNKFKSFFRKIFKVK